MALVHEDLKSFWRSRIAKKLFSTRRPTTFKIEKPAFPKITPDKIPLLDELIGPNSWLIFSLIKLDASQDWLQLPPEHWELMTDYRKLRDFVKTLEVTNDGAERNVKLMGDLANITKDEDQFQYAMQVTAAHRRLIPSPNKENLNKRLFNDSNST